MGEFFELVATDCAGRVLCLSICEFSLSVFRKCEEVTYSRVSLVAQMVKNLPAMQDTRVRSLLGKIPWRREWQPTPVFLPGDSHGQGSLVGYSPWGCKELDMTERLSMRARAYSQILYEPEEMC